MTAARAESSRSWHDIVLMAVVIVLVIVPAAIAFVVAPASDTPITIPKLSLVISTVVWAIAVAALSTCIGFLVAPALAFGSRWLCAVATWPLMLPGYFAYSGLSILRAPGSTLGDFLASRSAAGEPIPASSAAAIFALVGLTLSIWPLPAFVIASSLRSAGPHVRDALKLDTGAISRTIETFKMLLPSVAGSCTIVTLVMLGSPVPFHLAQVRTLSIAAWLELQTSSSTVSAWMTMLPLLFPVVVGAMWLATKIRALSESSAEEPTARDGTRFGRYAIVLVVAAISAMLPALMYFGSIRESRAFFEFWSFNSKALGSSTIVAVCCVLVSVILFYCFASRVIRGSKLLTASLAILLVAGLSPGILIGSVWSVLTPRLPMWFADSAAPIVLSHLTRFSMIAAIAGMFAGALETKQSRDQRVMDGADGLRGYLAARLRHDLPLALGAALLVGVLSLHEIESSVLVQPPGMQSIAARMLNDLHQLRMDSVSAAALWLWLLGGIPALLAAVLFQRGSANRV